MVYINRFDFGRTVHNYGEKMLIVLCVWVFLKKNHQNIFVKIIFLIKKTTISNFFVIDYMMSASNTYTFICKSTANKKSLLRTFREKNNFHQNVPINFVHLVISYHCRFITGYCE